MHVFTNVFHYCLLVINMHMNKHTLNTSDTGALKHVKLSHTHDDPADRFTSPWQQDLRKTRCTTKRLTHFVIV